MGHVEGGAGATFTTTDNWLKILWLGPYAPWRPKRAIVEAQLPLFEPDALA